MSSGLFLRPSTHAGAIETYLDTLCTRICLRLYFSHRRLIRDTQRTELTRGTEADLLVGEFLILKATDVFSEL